MDDQALALAFALGSERGAVFISGVGVAGIGALLAVAILFPGVATLAIRVIEQVAS